MRELKYRARHKDKWYYFTLRGLVIDAEPYYWLNNPDTIIDEFTGLLDKNGKEIYEGDRLQVEFPEYTGKEPDNGWVIWDNTEGSWRVQSYAWWSYIIPADMEVIGNVHENPDLLNN